MLCWLAVLATLVVELGFPVILFVRSVRFRAVFLLGLTGFHIANALLAGVNFWVTPVLFVVFFDLGRFTARERVPAPVTIS